MFWCPGLPAQGQGLRAGGGHDQVSGGRCHPAGSLATSIQEARTGRRRAAGGSKAGSPAALLDTLTSREREVLAQLAAGLGNRAIAQRLGIGEGTMPSHVHLVLQKLQVSNRTQAALLRLSSQPEGSDPLEREWPGQG